MKLTRRFLMKLFALLACRGFDLLAAEAGPRQLFLRKGTMSGEVTSASALLQTRLTQAIKLNASVTPQGSFLQITAGFELGFEWFDSHGPPLYRVVR